MSPEEKANENVDHPSLIGFYVWLNFENDDWHLGKEGMELPHQVWELLKQYMEEHGENDDLIGGSHE